MLFKCPFPDCNHAFEILTVNHAKSHGMTKQELIEWHGAPQWLSIDTKAYRANMQAWVKPAPVKIATRKDGSE